MNNIAIRVNNLSKCYHIYDRPQDRLKQSIVPKLRSLVGRNPGRYFREFWALNNVSFEVGRGETVGIIGRNGSGKSTLLQMICGTLEPTTGSVETNGRVAALLELGAGFNPEFTGRENVYMNATVLGLTQDEIHARFNEIAAFADIGDFIEQPVKHYSSGMYARLAFAVAINVDPSILIVDEALAVGDEPFQRKCFARIEEIKRGGGTILFVSHSTEAIVNLCDRAVLLYKGEHLFTGAPKLAIGWYQKLMNATSEQDTQIIEEIQQNGAQIKVEDKTSSKTAHANLSFGSDNDEGLNANLVIEAEHDIEESFDSNFVSKSMLVYEPNGAEISNIRLTTLDGRDVNQLINRKRYRVTYTANFYQNCNNVNCFFALKTVNGTMLGGGRFPPEGEEGIDCLASSMLSLSFEFECALLSGVYFVNCGVLRSDGSLAHRVLDALVFRVTSSEKRYSSGIVDFHVTTVLEVAEKY